jgi:hypothetical protein
VNRSTLRTLVRPLPAILVLIVMALLFTLPSSVPVSVGGSGGPSWIGATPAYADTADSSAIDPNPTPDDPVRPHPRWLD